MTKYFFKLEFVKVFHHNRYLVIFSVASVLN